MEKRMVALLMIALWAVAMQAELCLCDNAEDSSPDSWMDWAQQKMNGVGLNKESAENLKDQAGDAASKAAESAKSGYDAAKEKASELGDKVNTRETSEL